MTNPAAPPGWYPDPSGRPGSLYWDGAKWHPAQPAVPGTQHVVPGGMRVWRNVMLVLGLIAAAGWLIYGFSDTYVADTNCGIVMSPKPMADDYSQAVCAEALNSHATTTGAIAVLAFICFAVALTIHLTSKRKM